MHKSEDVIGDLQQANGSYEGAFDETKYTAKLNTHIHTHPGGGKTQSNKQFEKLELDFAKKEEAVEGSFSQASARQSTCAHTNLTGCHIEIHTVSRALNHP